MPERVKLTKSAVDRRQPRDAEYTAWDTEVAGFGCRVYPTGRRTYVFQYRPRESRRVRKVTIGVHAALAPAEARRIALRHAGEVAAGRDRAHERTEARRNEPTLTVEGLFERYADWLDQAGLSRVDDDHSKVHRHINPALRKRLAVAVTTEDVERLEPLTR